MIRHKREDKIVIKVTDYEKKEIKELAEEKGNTMSDFIRKLIMEYKKTRK